MQAWRIVPTEVGTKTCRSYILYVHMYLILCIWLVH